MMRNQPQYTMRLAHVAKSVVNFTDYPQLLELRASQTRTARGAPPPDLQVWSRGTGVVIASAGSHGRTPLVICIDWCTPAFCARNSGNGNATPATLAAKACKK